MRDKAAAGVSIQKHTFPQAVHVSDLKEDFDDRHYIDHDKNGWWTVHEGSESCFHTVSVPKEDDAVAEWQRIMGKRTDEDA